jgi:hypothetical protein
MSQFVQENAFVGAEVKLLPWQLRLLEIRRRKKQEFLSVIARFMGRKPNKYEGSMREA